MLFASEKVVLFNAKTKQYEIKAACIEVQGSLIKGTEVAKPGELDKSSSQNYLYFEDKLISPAFINSHTHIAMNCFRGISHALSKRNMIEDLFYHVEKHLEPQDVYAFAKIGAFESIIAGVGFIWDHYYHGLELAQALYDTGLAGVIAPTLQDIKGPGVCLLEKEWQATCLIDDNTFYKNRGIFAAFGPHASDSVSVALLSKVAKEAKLRQLPVHMHIAQSYEESKAARANGQTSPYQLLKQSKILTQAPHSLLVHNIFGQEQDLEELPKANTTLCFCPFSQSVFALPADVLLWEKTGLRWTVATDCAASNDSMNPQKELRQVAAIPSYKITNSQVYQAFQSGKSEELDEVVALRRVSKKSWTHFNDPSWLLDKLWQLPGSMHPQIKVGSLEKGALANIAIWDLNHPSLWPCDSLHALAFCDSVSALHGLVIAGRELGEYGRFHDSLFHSESYKSSLVEAKERLCDLYARAGLTSLWRESAKDVS